MHPLDSHSSLSCGSAASWRSLRYNLTVSVYSWSGVGAVAVACCTDSKRVSPIGPYAASFAVLSARAFPLDVKSLPPVCTAHLTMAARRGSVSAFISS